MDGGVGPFYLHSEIFSCPIHGEFHFTRALTSDGRLLGSVGAWQPCPCYYQIDEHVEREFSQEGPRVKKTLDTRQISFL